ncbi:MAG: hypothetical protein HYV63_16705 [Candidatus Schekmanbacteria bacterium]|nr:hypothetical protein [Candidatus Schekmanbacteria bacterium]
MGRGHEQVSEASMVAALAARRRPDERFTRQRRQGTGASVAVIPFYGSIGNWQ